MKNTAKKGAGKTAPAQVNAPKATLSPAEQLAGFRLYLENVFAPCLGDEAEQVTREFYRELIELLCLTFELDGFAGARLVIAEISQHLQLKSKKGVR